MRVHPLDRPVWSALADTSERFAERAGGAAAYLPDVAPFAAFVETPQWPDLAKVLGPSRQGVLLGLDDEPPAGWTVGLHLPGVQLDGSGLQTRPDEEAVVLGADDVPDMLDLVARTRPGPFLPRTVELGTYLGIRRGGALVAMAGERMRPPGWSEISGVCTDPACRGQGLAARLVRAVGAVIRARGEVPFLHTGATNTNALRLYAQLGFTLRKETSFTGVRAPGPLSPGGSPAG